MSNDATKNLGELGLLTTVSGGVVTIAGLAAPNAGSLASGLGASMIGYQLSAPGSVPTTVASELSRRINVWDFADANALGYGPLAPEQDWTSTIQAAVNFAQNATGITFKSTHSTTVFFPAGDYHVHGTVYLTGAVSLEGDGGPASYIGSNLRSQTVGNVSTGGTTVPMFLISATTGGSFLFDRMSFIDSGGSHVANQGMIQTTGGLTDGSTNSIYFRDCWFKSSYCYCISVTGGGVDDLQIVDCTFDTVATGHSCIRLGSDTGYTINTTISGCAFYTVNPIPSFIDLDNTQGCLITNNRFYVDPHFPLNNATSVISFVSTRSTDVIIANNFSQGHATFVTLNGNRVSITGNIANCSYVPVIINGGSTHDKINITGNTFTGVTGAYGVIDAGGVTLTSSIIQANVLDAGGGSYSLNTPSTNYTSTSNRIGNNISKNATTDGSNGVMPWSPNIYYSGGGGTINFTSSGNYIISDGFVTANFTITTTSTTNTTGSGTVIIGLLPIPVGSNTARGSVVFDKIVYPVSVTQTTMATLSANAASNILQIVFSGSGATAVGMQGVLPTNATISGSITYMY